MKWILGFDDNGKKATKRFDSLDDLFAFVEACALPRFKCKRV